MTRVQLISLAAYLVATLSLACAEPRRSLQDAAFEARRAALNAAVAGIRRETGAIAGPVIGRDTGLAHKYTYELEDVVLSGMPVVGVAKLIDIRRSSTGLEGVFWSRSYGNPSVLFILAIPDSLAQRLAALPRDFWVTQVVLSARLTSITRPLLTLDAGATVPEETPLIEEIPNSTFVARGRLLAYRAVQR